MTETILESARLRSNINDTNLPRGHLRLLRNAILHEGKDNPSKIHADTTVLRLLELDF
jgi:hypothetical protein